MPRFVPPAGAPLDTWQVLRAFVRGVTLNHFDQDGLQSLAERLQVPHIVAVSSGRAALWLILRALRRLRPDRQVVALPAYTCFSVPASVVRAGLKIFPVEADPEGLGPDLSQLDKLPKEGLLCLVTANLFGLTDDISKLREVARSRGAYLVDDAAQALGASRNGCFAGTSADVGFFSLGRGKVLAAGEGGLIVTGIPQIAESLQADTRTLPSPSYAHRMGLLIQLLAYSAFLKPSRYWIPNSLPFLKLGITEFDPEFRAARMARVSQALLPELLDRLQELNDIRQRNASAIARALAGNPSFTSPKVSEGTRASFIRFPILARDKAIRDRAVRLLQAAGIGGTAFYPSAICDIAGIEPHMATTDFHRPMAENLSRRLLTLPTHPFVETRDLNKMAEVLSKI